MCGQWGLTFVLLRLGADMVDPPMHSRPTGFVHKDAMMLCVAYFRMIHYYCRRFP